MKILITGSRDWPDTDGGRGIIHCAIVDVIKRKYYPNRPKKEDILIIHGAARGADTIAANWADEKGVPHTKDRYKVTSADWSKQGKAAGVLRNHRMLDENPDTDVVIAFWKNKSRGTKDMIDYAQKAGKKVIIYET